MQEWASISQDLAQELTDSMQRQIAEILRGGGDQNCKYVIVSESLWNASNYTSVIIETSDKKI